MNKKKVIKITCISFLILIIIGSYFFLNGNPIKITKIEKNILSYLVNKGYDKEEIKLIEGEYEWLKSSSYYGKVVFRDEPHDVYYYSYNNKGKIFQCGMSNFGRHSEK